MTFHSSHGALAHGTPEGHEQATDDAACGNGGQPGGVPLPCRVRGPGISDAFPAMVCWS